MLELAILGILHESPMHGYELRKQLATKLGTFRAAISYGSLYPTLRRLQAANWITEGEPETESDAAATEIPAMTSRRGRVVYKITAEGKERFQELPEAYQTLLLDVMEGDQTLFVHADEVEAAWRLFTPILDNTLAVSFYAAGTWGPKESDELMQRNGQKWSNRE